MVKKNRIKKENMKEDIIYDNPYDLILGDYIK